MTAKGVDSNADSGGAPDPLLNRQGALNAFEKLEAACRLIQEAVAERPSLQVLDLGPLLRTVADGMRILALKDSELDLPGLILKHEWCVGQRFYVRAKVEDPSGPTFLVLAGQDIPEGVLISARRTVPNLLPGQTVGLDLEIRRRSSKRAWHIRAVDCK